MREQGDMSETPGVVKASFWLLCYVLDVMYDNRPIQK